VAGCPLRDNQRRLYKLSQKARKNGLSTVLVFEGWDSAGKGGAIRRLVSSMNAANCRVVPIAAPNDEERAHHYLWRFWRHLPRAGRMLIFDRSWYGRVLVERVEGFATPEDWRRAYDEINDFERQITEHGTLLLKFWLHIDKDEQLRRFEERKITPRKQYKITEEDYRNRERWDDYLAAANEMVARTSPTAAPWVLVPANDKRTARIDVLTQVCDRLERLL
jgi:polyphosphate kinase 2 (PPK2 family)